MEIENFGDLVKYKREAKGYTAVALSQKTGIDPAYISRLEKSSIKQPAFVTTMKIAKALDISIQEISRVFNVEPIKETDKIIEKPKDIYMNDILTNMNKDILYSKNSISTETIDIVINLLNNLKKIAQKEIEPDKYILLNVDEENGYAVKCKIINENIKKFVSKVLSGKCIAIIEGSISDSGFEVISLEEVLEIAESFEEVFEHEINNIKKYL